MLLLPTGCQSESADSANFLSLHSSRPSHPSSLTWGELEDWGRPGRLHFCFWFVEFYFQLVFESFEFRSCDSEFWQKRCKVVKDGDRSLIQLFVIWVQAKLKFVCRAFVSVRRSFLLIKLWMMDPRGFHYAVRYVLRWNFVRSPNSNILSLRVNLSKFETRVWWSV